MRAQYGVWGLRAGEFGGNLPDENGVQPRPCSLLLRVTRRIGSANCLFSLKQKSADLGPMWTPLRRLNLP